MIITVADSNLEMFLPTLRSKESPGRLTKIPPLLLFGIILHHPWLLAFDVHHTKWPVTFEFLFARLHHVIKVPKVVLIPQIETECYRRVNLWNWHLPHLCAMVSLPVGIADFYLGVGWAVWFWWQVHAPWAVGSGSCLRWFRLLFVFRFWLHFCLHINHQWSNLKLTFRGNEDLWIVLQVKY